MSVCKKSKYAQESFALKDIERFKSKKNYKPLRAYKCDKCASWHLTSRVDHQEIINSIQKKITELTTELEEAKKSWPDERPHYSRKINLLSLENIKLKERCKSLQRTIEDLIKKVNN